MGGGGNGQPVKARSAGRLRCLGDFARSEATCANSHPFIRAGRRLDPHALEIRIPASPGMIIRVADIVPVYRPFSTHFTASGHDPNPHDVVSIIKNYRLSGSFM